MKSKLKKYQVHILKKMGLKPTSKVFDNLNSKDIDRYNTYRQKKVGIKKYDYFTLTEYGEENKFLKFHNLKEWSKAEYLYQKKHNTDVGDKNSLYIPSYWFRALEINEITSKRELTYGTLVSSNSYLFELVIDNIQNEINKRIPSILVSKYGEPFFKKIKNSKFNTLRDSDRRALGREKELTKVTQRLNKLRLDIEKDINKKVKKYDKYTFRIKMENADVDYFIIGGFKASKQISFKTFFKNFYELLQPYEVLDNLAEDISKKYIKKIFKGVK